jgi:ribosomal protein RSM22 (predicted rRNA methylase)
MEKRIYQLPEAQSDRIKTNVKALGYKISDSKKLAQMVVELSKKYHQQDGLTELWRDIENQVAYWVYFFPLNYLRMRAILDEALERNFFTGIDELIDFGSGPGTSHFAILDTDKLKLNRFHFLERSPQAIQQHQTALGFSRDPQMTWNEKPKPHAKSVVTFSYSLNEVKSLPPWTKDSEALLILEPSTRQEGRNLQQLRSQLIENSFYVWAPCVHQNSCPLLEHSKKDWCHDRIFTQLPDWFYDLEKYLPMTNQSVTFSYLLARKTPPEPIKNTIRVIGDTLKEKGKEKQLICRGQEREFLSWLTKKGVPPHIPRGSLFVLEPGFEKKGNEVRPIVKP